MTVSSIRHKNNRNKEIKDYLFIFKDCETLTAGILFLYRLNLNFESKLYKTEGEYRLIITSLGFKPCFLTLGEYCLRQSKSVFEVEFTKEHGKPLILKNAIRTYGRYFFKET